MKLDIRTKLVLVSLGLIAASIFILESYLRPQVEQEIVESVRTDLFARLSLVERDIAPQAAGGLPPAKWDALADEFGGRAEMRLTLIDPNGVVVGDSQVELSGLPTLENHGDRPEVRLALRGNSVFSLGKAPP